MYAFVVLTLALACSSAASILNTPVYPKDVIKNERNIEGRITNGHPSNEGQIPYQVGLSLNARSGSQLCGGSIIGKEWVLTAAHCTDGVESAIVYLGSLVRDDFTVAYSVTYKEIYQHRQFNPSTFANDISLIRIPPVTYTNNIQPIKLPAISSSYSTYEDEYVIASGWGRTDDSKYDTELQK